MSKCSKTVSGKHIYNEYLKISESELYAQNHNTFEIEKFYRKCSACGTINDEKIIYIDYGTGDEVDINNFIKV